MPQSHEEIKREFRKKFNFMPSQGAEFEDVEDFWFHAFSQRDADKGGNKCVDTSNKTVKIDDYGVPYTTPSPKDPAKCEWCGKDMFKLMTTEPSMCIEGKYHSPKPQANVGEWEEQLRKEFKEQFLFSLSSEKAIKGMIHIADFFIAKFYTLLSTTSAQKLEGLERSVEGMRKEEIATFKNTFTGDLRKQVSEFNKGFNSCLTAVLDIIRKRK